MVSYNFKKKEDLLKFANNGPWTVKGSLMNLKKWDANLTVEEVDFSHCKFWTKSTTYHQIDKTEKMLSRLATTSDCFYTVRKVTICLYQESSSESKLISTSKTI